MVVVANAAMTAILVVTELVLLVIVKWSGLSRHETHLFKVIAMFPLLLQF